MLDSNKVVHGLWIGKTLSKVELLTIQSFIACGHTFWLWAYEAIETALPEETIRKDARTILPEHSVFRYMAGNQFGHGKGSLAGFSDIFRYKLLYEYGGWWTDMDVTCLRPLDFESPYLFRSHDVFPVVGNIMKCPKNSELMRDCFEIAQATVTADNTDWLKPIRILNNGIQKYNLTPFIQSISNADRWEIVNFYFTYPAKPKPNFYVFHWMNEEWRARGIDKNSCIKYSFLDHLMLKYQIEMVRSLPPHQIIYVLKLLKIKLVPLVPRPVRFVLKMSWTYTRAIFRSMSAQVLPLFPRSWKDAVKRAVF